ncbi:tRNA-m1A22 methylase [Rhodopirellula islandica]|uniref:tRNA-m1A22 methylase n=1 Tax=Rhodopirellula islandica TaxID=595434 RepID=A0A0J1B6P8_RHOIS|nr:class I SAM-dependent methyltransferase [Rhodopirellula islandica]KLU02495.1 tRNA-m1A22 methylase [Rhodopirellula islandica]
MPRLDDRLKLVASLIRGTNHADIGSDHGHLLAALLATGRIQRGIAVENKPQPHRNSTATLQGLNAEVRLGDGLNVIQENELDSLSICGMGGQSIVRILANHSNRLPDQMILQPNKAIGSVRQWALNNGYWLVDEQCTAGTRRFEVLLLRRSGMALDPVYRRLASVRLEESLGVMFGPWFLLRRDEDLQQRLAEEQRYLHAKQKLTAPSRQRMEAIDRLLSHDHFLSR